MHMDVESLDCKLLPNRCGPSSSLLAAALSYGHNKRQGGGYRVWYRRVRWRFVHLNSCLIEHADSQRRRRTNTASTTPPLPEASASDWVHCPHWDSFLMDTSHALWTVRELRGCKVISEQISRRPLWVHFFWKSCYMCKVLQEIAASLRRSDDVDLLFRGLLSGPVSSLESMEHKTKAHLYLQWYGYNLFHSHRSRGMEELNDSALRCMEELNDSALGKLFVQSNGAVSRAFPLIALLAVLVCVCSFQNLRNNNWFMQLQFWSFFCISS